MTLALPNSRTALAIDAATGLGAGKTYVLVEAFWFGARLVAFARPGWASAGVVLVGDDGTFERPDWDALGAGSRQTALEAQTRALDEAEESRSLVCRIDSACALPKTAGVCLWRWDGLWVPAGTEALDALADGASMFRAPAGIVLMGQGAAACASAPTLAELCAGILAEAEP